MSIQCNCSNPRVQWGRYKSGCNLSRSVTRTASRLGCNSGRSTTGRTMGSNSGPSASLHRHGNLYTPGRATSSSTRSESPRTGSRARTVEVITLSSGSESDEDLEVIAARLRKAKCLKQSQRKYTETTRSTRRIFQSKAWGRKDEEITLEEENSSKRETTGRNGCMCPTPRVPYKKMGMIRPSHQNH